MVVFPSTASAVFSPGAIGVAETALDVASFAVPALRALLALTAVANLGYEAYKNWDDISDFVSDLSDNFSLSPGKNFDSSVWGDDSHSTVPDSSFGWNDNFSDTKNKSSDWNLSYSNFKLLDNLLVKSFVDARPDYKINLENVSKSLNDNVTQDVKVEVEKGSNLLDTLSKNSSVLVKALGVLNNTIASGVVSSSVSLNVIASNLSNLVNEIIELRKTIALSSVANTKALDTISKAKELEKEHYEFMKTPQTYTLSDETLPNLSPREVVALSEAIKAHLNSQEASLTGEELSDFENDFDLRDVLTQLFDFRGISEDISKIRR